MADRIELQVGDLPWKPTGSEEPLVLHKYDMPLSGIIDQHGASYFFWCIRGEITRGTLWGYAPIGDQERHEIENEPRDQVIRRLFSSPRPCTLAFSVDGRGIVKWKDFESKPRTYNLLRSRSEERLLELTPEESQLLETL